MTSLPDFITDITNSILWAHCRIAKACSFRRDHPNGANSTATYIGDTSAMNESGDLVVIPNGREVILPLALFRAYDDEKRAAPFRGEPPPKGRPTPVAIIDNPRPEWAAGPKMLLRHRLHQRKLPSNVPIRERKSPFLRSVEKPNSYQYQ